MADDQQDNEYTEGYNSATNLADVEFTAERVNDTYFNPLSYLGFRALAKRHGGEDAGADLSKFYSPVTAGVGNQARQIMGAPPGYPMYGTGLRGMYAPRTGKVHVNTSDFLDLYHSGDAGELTREEALDLQRKDLNRVESHEFGHAGFEHLKKQGKLPPGDFDEEDVMKVLDSIQFYKRLGTPRPVQPAREKLNFEESSLVSWPIARIAMGVVSRQQNINRLLLEYPYSRKLSRNQEKRVDYIVDLISAAEKELSLQARFPPAPKPEGNAITNFFQRHFGSSSDADVEEGRKPEKRAHGGFVDKPLYDRDPYG
tara:strand:- start:628 stop:1566 length:939 start_codon:yes stop_codon:yes gene_type:complete